MRIITILRKTTVNAILHLYREELRKSSGAVVDKHVLSPDSLLEYRKIFLQTFKQLHDRAATEQEVGNVS